jgi:protocatechuate 3,4-dioxygenase beta subunit
MRTGLLQSLILALAAAAPAGELTGRVVSDRKGVIGATVAAIPYESRYAAAWREVRGQSAPAAIATGITSADGRFKLTTPAEAPPFVVRATFGGLASRTIDGVFEKTDSEDLGEIVLSRGESVTGRVVGPSGKPVAGALVRIGRDGVVKTTNPEGLFRFDDLAGRGTQPFAPAVTMSVDAAGFEVQAAPVRYSGSPVTIALKPSTRKLTAQLKEWGGRPATDAVVRIVGDPTTRWVRTDAAGRFEIPGAPSTQGRLQALGRDGSLLELTLPSTLPATFTLNRAATIEGRVTRADDGKLVRGVKVMARSTGTTLIVRTGADGRYRLAGLPPGAYRITFDEAAYVIVDRQRIEATAGEMKPLDVALTPAVALVGRVNDEKGLPIEGVQGSLSSGAESRMGMMMRAMARDTSARSAFVTGPDGTFRATRLAPGLNQKLTLTHADFERRVIPGVDLPAGAPRPATIDVVLSPGFVLSGAVKDKEGRPVEGAQVALNRSVTMQGGRAGNMVSISTSESVRPQSETDFEGKFGFRGLSSGDYDVTISKAGFTRHVANGIKAGDGATPLEVVLNPGASIAGRLAQPNGQPVTGYSVNARPSSPAGAGSPGLMGARGGAMVPTDPDGGFVLEGLIPGTAYDLAIFGPGEFRGDAKKKSVVAPASDVGIEVAARGRITGRVVDAATGAPITDFESSIAPARSGGMVLVVRGPGESDRRTPFSSPEGAFVFEDVAPGNWDVTVWAKTYQQARTGGVAVAAGETKTVEVKAARGLVIRGRVVDSKTGRGVQEATVSARDGGGSVGIFVLDPSGAGGALTDADGRFEIVDQAPGSYQLTARHALFPEGTARIVLDDKDGAIDIPLVPGGTIGGVVISSQGAPLAGAEVGLQNSGDGGGIRFGMEGQGTLTDGAGRFRFDHLAAGRYKVGATLRNEGSPLLDVALGPGDAREDIRLTLDAGATVRGTLKGLSETERGGVMVGAQAAPDYFANSRTNADGSFEFTGVPKGSVTLRATAGDMVLGATRTATREVQVNEGQTEVLTEIIFEEGLSISGTVMRRGAPVSGARISAFTTATGRQASGRTDENGGFRVLGLEAGRVTVVAFSENFGAQARQVLEITGDTTVDLVIPTARLGGTVVDDVSGLPLESTVELQRSAPATPGTPSPRLAASTDTSGRFAFEDLDAVDYRITARRSAYESLTQTVKPSEAGEELRLALKRGSGLAIEARDAHMGFGIRSLFVRIQEGTAEAFMGGVALDNEGKGEIPGLPQGAYRVTATSPGYAPVQIPNVMAPSTVLKLLFTPGGAVEFRTTEDFLAGGAKTGQLVSVTGAPMGLGQGGPDSFRLSRLTQRMENLAPGRYRLTLDGGVDKTFEITEGGVAIVTIP